MNTLRGASELYWQQNWLGYNDKINAQFYDPGRDRLAGAQALPSLMSLRAKKPFEGRREVLVVDSDEDFEFRRFVDSVYELIVLVPTQHARILMAARLVAERLGGPGVTQGKTMYHSRDSVVCHIGNFSKGVCRHRALLFKALADALPAGCSFPCKLIRGELKEPGTSPTARNPVRGTKPHAWNVVRVQGQNFVLDLMHSPDSLYGTESPEAAAYMRTGRSRQVVGRAGLDSCCAEPLLTERIQGDPRREWIARGGFAEVYKVLLTDDIEIALKEIKLPGEAAEAERVRKEYKHEAQNFSRLRHKNIAEYLHADDSCKGYLRIYMELLPDGSMLQNKERIRSWPLSQRLKIAFEVASALEYLHQLQPAIAHLDVKPANVMLKNGEAKMVDFGLATPIASTHTSPQGKAYEHLGLTRHFAAPERFVQLPDSYGKQDTIGVKADVYSFGLLLYFLWSCQEPWQAELNSFGWTQELQRRIVEEGERPRLPNTMPQEVAEVVEATLKHSSRDRPTMKEVAATLQQLHHDAVRDQSRRHLLGCKTNFGPSGAAQSHTAVQQPNK
ncbi:hypothetical protein WJX74_003058 [Apatococcus lobatus]|uniref:Protein kinase domain-containing protein n=1 Tax=Apatococcus lobatus TaxID=904363 RepID=A0AAW1RH92_9CHLO